MWWNIPREIHSIFWVFRKIWLDINGLNVPSRDTNVSGRVLEIKRTFMEKRLLVRENQLPVRPRRECKSDDSFGSKELRSHSQFLCTYCENTHIDNAYGCISILSQLKPTHEQKLEKTKRLCFFERMICLASTTTIWIRKINA